MLGSYHRHHPTAVQVPPWPLALPVADSRLLPHLPCSALSSLQFPDDASEDDPPELPLDAYSSDEFRMYEFKVRSCARVRPHDWTDCPCAHPGEKARRRDPRLYHYLGTPCPDFRKGSCGRGDSCMFSHGVFECWLHPTRYRTEPCKEGVACRRKVCFFAHTQAQLRLVPSQQQASRSPPSPDSYDGSPMRRRCVLEACLPKGFLMSSSPTSTLVPPPSPPPPDSPPGGAVRSSGSSVNEVLASLRKLQIRKAKLFGPAMEMDPPEDPDVAWVSDLIS